MTQKKKDLLLGIIRKYMAIKRIADWKELAVVLGMNYRTFQRRIAEPETFSMGEMNRIVRFLAIPREELAEVWGC